MVRKKTNMRFKVLEKRAVARAGKDAKVQILADETVEPALAKSKALYPKPLRRVRARVEVDGKMVEMACWSAFCFGS